MFLVKKIKYIKQHETFFFFLKRFFFMAQDTRSHKTFYDHRQNKKKICTLKDKMLLEDGIAQVPFVVFT